MRWFKEFVKTTKYTPLFSAEGRRERIDATCEYLTQAQPFVFTPKNEETGRIGFDQHSKSDLALKHELEDYQISMPFPVISIEVLGEPIMAADLRSGLEHKFNTYAILIKEISPMKYDFKLLVGEELNGDPEDIKFYIINIDDKPKSEMSKDDWHFISTLYALLEHFLKRMQTEEVGKQNPKFKFKRKISGPRKGTEFHKVRKVICVSPKKDMNKYDYLDNVEWGHSWTVRGHWRRTNDETLGKDRNGDYCVKGYTWIAPHIKGEGPLIKKVRVVR